MIIHRCDNCGKEDKEVFRPIIVCCGYGSKFDGQNFDFCSDECCAEFFSKKQNAN